MNDQRLAELLRESRPQVEPDPSVMAAARARLSTPDLDDTPLFARLMVPVSAVLLVFLLVTQPQATPQASEMPNPEDWSTPLDPSEIQPWMIVRPSPAPAYDPIPDDFKPIPLVGPVRKRG